MTKIMNIRNADGTGICLGANINGYPSQRIKDSIISVYTDSNRDEIVRFMVNAAEDLGIALKLGFKKQSNEKYEWDID